ncbi:MAG: G5 domain-containing protein [Candidatus Andersenbacteria bacterium]
MLTAFLTTQTVQAASLFELARDGAPADPVPALPAADAGANSDGANGSTRISIVDNGLAADAVVTSSATGVSVEQLLSSLGFSLAPEDVVFPPRTAPAPTFGAVIIDRAAGVTLVHDGKKEEVKTRATTVGQLLGDKGVTLKGDDRVEPAASTAVVPNLSVRVVRVTTKEQKQKEPIAFESQDKDDATMYQGDSKVTQAGKAGEKELTYKLTLEDGQQIKKEKTGEKVLSKPVTQITAHGTKVRPKTADSGPFRDLINAAAAKYGVDGAEMMRVMLCESGGYQWSKDKSGTHFGLFQYTPSFYRSGPYGDRDIYDPTGQIYNTAYFWSIGRRGAWGC